MGTCYSTVTSDAAVNLRSDDPVTCDITAGTASDVADNDSTTNQRGHNVGQLVKTLSAKLTIATNSSTQQEPVKPRPRRTKRRSSAQRRRTSLDSRASACSDSIDEFVDAFLNRARRMSSHLMHRRSSAVSPSSKDNLPGPRESITMESILGHGDYEEPID